MDQGQAASKPQPEGKQEVVTLCLVCNSQLPLGTERCPKCGLETCVMRKCPACRQLVSAKHKKCIYCSESFIGATADGASGSPIPAFATARPKMTRKALLVSVLTFAAVFTFVLTVTRMYGPPETVVKGKIGRSYALYRAPLYRDDTLSGAPIAHVGANEIVDVTDFASPGLQTRWLQVKSSVGKGYVAQRDFAPIEAQQELYGYQAIRAYLVTTSEADRLNLAGNAVAYYRKKFPKSSHAPELLWTFAERAREVGAQEHNAELLQRARAAYADLAAVDGLYRSQAQERLDNDIPTERATKGQPAAAERRRPAPALEIVGSGQIRGSGGQPAREVTLITQPDIAVSVPTVANARPGVVLEARIARDIRSSGRNSIPAGTPCYITLLEPVEPNVFMARLTGIKIGNVIVPVSTAPMRITRSSAGVEGQSISFKLQAPIAVGN